MTLTIAEVPKEERHLLFCSDLPEILSLEIQSAAINHSPAGWGEPIREWSPIDRKRRRPRRSHRKGQAS